jgi:hypothetical protein
MLLRIPNKENSISIPVAMDGAKDISRLRHLAQNIPESSRISRYF